MFEKIQAKIDEARSKDLRNEMIFSAAIIIRN